MNCFRFVFSAGALVLASCASSSKTVGQVAPDGRDISLQFSRDRSSLLSQQPASESIAARDALLQRKDQTLELLASVAELSLIGGKYDEAAEQARAVLKRDFKNADAMKTLIKVYILTNRYHESMLLADNALQIRPRDADIFCLKGLAAYSAGDPFSAREIWKKALEINPSHITAQMNLAALYFQNRNIGQAGGSFDRVLTVQPHNSDALVGRALVLDLQGNSEEAKRILTAAIVTDKKAPLVRYNLAVIERDRFQNFEEALDHLEVYLREAQKDRGSAERAVVMREELRMLIAKKKEKKLTDEQLREIAKKSSQSRRSDGEGLPSQFPDATAAGSDKNAPPSAPAAVSPAPSGSANSNEAQSLEDAIR